MSDTKLKEKRRWKRHKHLRHKLHGTQERPRMAVHRSLKHIYVQIIDDDRGITLASFSTRNRSDTNTAGGNVAAAKVVGAEIARIALERSIERVAFDRGGFKYHGRVKALADAAREGGLEF